MNGALVLGSLVVAIMIGEGVLRAVGFSDPVFWTYDDVTGSKLLPNAKGWYRSEGEAYVTISNSGLRDREHSRAKPANTARIVVLGDSMAEALQVPLEKTFWSLLEQKLTACRAFGSREVEVINFGVSGYGTAQALLTLRHRAAAYSPDLTLLAFYAGNDVRNNAKELEPFKLRPFFTLESGKLIPDNGFLDDPEYQSFKASFEKKKLLFDLRVFQLVRKLKTLLEQSHAAEARGGNIEPGVNDDIFLAPASTAWADAWEVTEQLIVAARDEARAAGSRFLLFTIPIAIQTYPDAALRQRFTRTLGIHDLWYPEQRLMELGRRENVDILPLGEKFQAYADSNQVFLHGFTNTKLGTGHLNEAGHKVISESIADHLCPSK